MGEAVQKLARSPEAAAGLTEMNRTNTILIQIGLNNGLFNIIEKHA